jgi:hypothetical protein
MDCRQVEKWIALYVEGDLDAGRNSIVSRHLESCDRCSRLLADYRDNQDLLHRYAPPEFTEEILVGVRSAVWKEIERGRPRFIARWGLWKPVLAASLSLIVAAALAVVYLERTKNQPPQKNPTVAVAAREYPTPRSNRESAAAKPVPRITGPVEPKAPARVASHAGAGRPDLNARAAASLKMAAAQEMLRIEFQTADPNIRIIWFAPRQPE